MYRLKLELDGYTVDVAGDGLAALEKARSTSPDIIFLDIRLPKLDGLGVLEALRGDPSDMLAGATGVGPRAFYVDTAPSTRCSRRVDSRSRRISCASTAG